MQAQARVAIAGPQSAALQLDGASGNGQAQAEPGTAVGKALVRFEDAFELRVRHAGALIAQAQVPNLAFAPAIQADPAFGWRMANGIAQQVLQGLCKAVQVGLYLAVDTKRTWQARRGPAAFEADVLAQGCPH